MPDKKRKYDSHFKEGAVRVVRETGKPIAQVAKDLDVPKPTLTNWVRLDREKHGERATPATADAERVRQLEKEVAELRMERDVLIRK